MIPIRDFSWHIATPLVVGHVSVGELYDLANQHHPQPFVLHDQADRFSALVIPDVVIQTVEEFNLPLSEPAAAVGLTDLLRQDQMTVHWNVSSSLVAALAAWQEAQAVIVVDDLAVPVGLFIPGEVIERLPRTSLIRQGPPELRQTVRRLTRLGDLAGAIAAIEGERTDFHSETLNSQGPSPYVCDDHGKPHIRSSCPCSHHPTATCGRRTAVST